MDKQELKKLKILDLFAGQQSVYKTYPANAASRYIMKEYIKNNCDYCMYGFPYKKATSIYTNKEIKLLKCNHKSHSVVMSGWKKRDGKTQASSSNKDRSIVPTELIKQVVKELTNV